MNTIQQSLLVERTGSHSTHTDNNRLLKSIASQNSSGSTVQSSRLLVNSKNVWRTQP